MKSLSESHILARILETKRRRVAESRLRVPETIVRKMASMEDPPPRFRDALTRNGGTRIIAEIKKASPSAGVLIEGLDVDQLAYAYGDAGAAAISVVTEEDFFQGNLGWIRRAAKCSGLPVLRKDFIFNSYQVAETRASGASAILLIVAMLEQHELQGLLTSCEEFGLDALVEVHDEAELAEALDAGATLVGINNRDLKTFEVDLETATRLGAHIPEGTLCVAESGIHSAVDIDRLRAAGADAFLVGERLVRSPDPGAALRELL